MDTKSARRDAISAQILAGRQMNCRLIVCFRSLIAGGSDEQLWTGFSEASFMAETLTNASPQRWNVARRRNRETIANGGDDRLRRIDTMQVSEGIDAIGH